MSTSSNHLLLSARAVHWFVLALLVSGCASKPFVFQPEHSFAMNVALAAGITEDYGPLTDTKVDLPSEEWNKLDLLIRGDNVLEAYRGNLNFNGLGTSTNVFFNVAGLLLSMPKPHPAKYSQWVVWLPAENLEYDAAFAQMASTFVDAYRQLLPEGYTVKTATKLYDALLVKDIESSISLLVGGKCREFTSAELEDRELWPKDAVKLEGICPVYYGLYYRPEEIPSPSWLGAKDSFAWGIVDGDRLLNHAYTPWAPLHHRGIEPSLSDMSQEEFNIALSALLPEWVYFYQAPQDKYTVPYVLNQGKKHYFIKPK